MRLSIPRGAVFLLSLCQLTVSLPTLTSKTSTSLRQPIDPPAYLFFDFDGTIAASDAYDTLAYAAYASLPPNSTVPSWESINAVYDLVYANATATLNASHRQTLAEEIAYQDASALRAVEEWSFDWVRSLGLFDTVREEELVARARNVSLVDGWCDAVAAAQQRGVRVAVASLNWSVRWIRLVLREASACAELVEELAVYAPEILPEHVLVPSALDRPTDLFSGGDKRALVGGIVGNGTDGAAAVVFVSDGVADLDPLWNRPTTVGVAVGRNNGAAQTLAQFGAQLWEVEGGCAQVPQKTGAAGTGGLYVLEDYYELAKWFACF